MKQIDRISGGLINRDTLMNFSFNGKKYQGYQGDTLASALLANGVRLLGRSFKYHRPRGVFTSGSEEPNALVELRRGAFKEPNSRATVVELFNQLDSKSQNHKGSLNFDLMAATDLFLAPFVGAGFYYKTFMWPAAFWEKLYEPIIRMSAGLGSLSKLEDPDHYDKGFLHCDVLIVGAGPAGIIAALAAGNAGAKVILADEDFLMGGRLNSELLEIDGMLGTDWARRAIGQLSNMENVRLMNRTTIYGSYDHGIFGALERCTDHLLHSDGKPRQILWKIYSKKSILMSKDLMVDHNNDNISIRISNKKNIKSKSRYEIVDWKKIKKKKLRIRLWREGDTFQSLGMNGHQKVSDFLINNKVNQFKKEKQHVLIANNEIIWICGLRISDKIKVTNDTTEFAYLILKTA